MDMLIRKQRQKFLNKFGVNQLKLTKQRKIGTTIKMP
jgi:hypothetical protein